MKISRFFLTGLFCFFLISKTNSFAQVIYTDPEPDIVFSMSFNNTVYYNFDVNNDSVSDFTFRISSSWMSVNSSIQSQNNTAFVFAGTYADTLNVNDTIGPSCNWSSSNLSLAGAYGSAVNGFWANKNNKFLGLRLVLNSDTSYAWVRLKIVTGGGGLKITIKDYAYNTQPNEILTAGSLILPEVENLTISDANNNKNGSDIKVSFEKAVDELKVSSYRVIIVNEMNAAAFNLDSAQQVATGNYFEFLPNGSDFSDTLFSDMRDNNGNLIQEFIPYKAFVLTMADGVLATQNVLSMPSNALMLSSPTMATTNILATDTFSGNEIYKINVSFNKIADESTLSEYRMFFVNTSFSTTFNVDSAGVVLPGGYYSVIPTGNNISVDFSSDTLNDISTNTIAHGEDYKVYVLSVADGVNANVNALSPPSNSVVLSTPAQAATNVLAEDVSEHGNAGDIRITFNKIPDESGILAYHIIVVKLADCSTFNLDSANAVSFGSFYTVNCTGTDINLLLPLSMPDKDGNAIENNTPYRFYVLSKSDSLHTDINALSLPSNILSLSVPNYFKAGYKIGADVHYHDLIPDTVVGQVYLNSSENFNFDLNADGVNDFKFSSAHSGSPSQSYGYSNVQSLNNNSICVTLPGSLTPDTLRSKSMINKDLFWGNGTFNLASYTFMSVPPWTNSTSGIWYNVNDLFMGLKVVINSDTIYAWVRLSVTPTRIVIKDYAWQQPVAGIDLQTDKPSFNVYPNPASDFIFVNAETKGALYFYSSIGQEVYSGDLDNGPNKIDISAFPAGIYVIKVTGNNSTLTRKLIIVR